MLNQIEYEYYIINIQKKKIITAAQTKEELEIFIKNMNPNDKMYNKEELSSFGLNAYNDSDWAGIYD